MTNMHTRQQKSVTCEKLARVSIFLPHILKSWPEGLVLLLSHSMQNTFQCHI